jgi:hypothetical protein
MHKLTTRLCRENQAVVIEDLHVKGMPANERLARSISDVGFGMFRSQIEYKACVPASRQVRQRVRPPRAGATAVQAASLRISAPGHNLPFRSRNPAVGTAALHRNLTDERTIGIRREQPFGK